MLEELGRKQRSVLVGNNLIVVAVHHQRGHVDALQILGEVGFRENLDPDVMRVSRAHHALAPPIIDGAFDAFRACSVKAVERTGRDVAIELGAIGGQAVAQLVEHLHR